MMIAFSKALNQRPPAKISVPCFHSPKCTRRGAWVYTSRMMRRWFWQFLPAAAVVLAAFLLYLNALPNPFLLDDHDAIATNPDVVQPARLGRLWVDDYWAGRGDDPNLYRPLTILSYRLNAAASGLSPEAFRLVNVLLLGLLGAGVLAWCRRWVGAAPATFAGLVVVAHPAAAETINIIVGRADLLAMLGVVAFLLVQQRAADRGWTLPLCVGGALAALAARAASAAGAWPSPRRPREASPAPPPPPRPTACALARAAATALASPETATWAAGCRRPQTVATHCCKAHSTTHAYEKYLSASRVTA